MYRRKKTDIYPSIFLFIYLLILLFSGQCPECLTFVLKNTNAAVRVESQLAKLQRAEISNPPIHDARIVSTVLNDPVLYSEW